MEESWMVRRIERVRGEKRAGLFFLNVWEGGWGGGESAGEIWGESRERDRVWGKIRQGNVGVPEKQAEHRRQNVPKTPLQSVLSIHGSKGNSEKARKR